MGLVILILAAALLFCVAPGSRDLWRPNEPIYALTVKDMFDNGTWLIPTANGQEYLDKPILYYWTALVFAHALGGVDETSLRLPPALAGVAVVALVYLWVVPYIGRRRAILVAALCATQFGVFWSARTIQMDIFVLLATVAALVPLSRMLDHGFNPRPAWVLAGLATGAGFLAKGPVGIVLPGLVYLAYTLSQRRNPFEHRRAMLLGGAVLFVVGAPWYVALWAVGRGDLLHEVLIRQNVTRFVEPWAHLRPWWYYLKYIWFYLAPWIWFIPLAIRLPPRTEAERSLRRLSWLWIFAVILFFSLSPGKRGPYILPIAPPVAVLAATVLDRLWSRDFSRLRSAVALGIFALIAFLFSVVGGALTSQAWAEVFPFDVNGLRPSTQVLAVVLAMGGAALTLTLVSSRHRLSTYTLIAVVAAFYMTAVIEVLPAMNERKSAREFCRQVESEMGPGNRLSTYRTWRVHAAYPFYLDRNVPNLDDPASLRDFWSEPGAFLLAEEYRVEEVREILGAEPLLVRKIGRRKAFLFSNSRGERASNLESDEER